MTVIELRTLGDCQIVIGDERLGPQSPYAFALALFLAVERGRPHSRDELLAMFSPGMPQANAAHSLRQTLYKLRQLGVPAETTPAGTVIAASEVRDDYSVLLATSELPDPRADRLPRQFLPGYWPKISAEFTAWLEGQRDAVHGALRRAYVARIVDRRAVARWDEVERFARACLVVDPLNEVATLALAEALALSGSKVAGMKVLDGYLEEVGQTDERLALPAAVLRKRISERIRPKVRVGDVQFLGRDEEMHELNQRLFDARAGVRTSLWLYGEPGIGKTRLIREFCDSALLSGARVVELSCRPHDTHRPYGVLGDLLPAVLALPGAIGCSGSTLALLNQLASRGIGQHRIEEWKDGEPATSKEIAELVATAVNELFDAVSSETLLIVALDDLHWADPSSFATIYSGMNIAANQTLMILVGSRTAPPPVYPRSTALALRHLKGLPLVSAQELVRSAASRLGLAISDHAVNRATLMGAGNPFFLRSLAEHFLANPDSPDLPSRLTEVLEQRVRGASAASEMILLACALLGRYATIHELEFVLQIPRYQLAGELEALEQSHLIVASDNCVEIAHSIIADCVLRCVSRSATVVIHRGCAESLERRAKSTGSLALYWAAYDCWTALGDQSAAARCAQDATTLDALGKLLLTFLNADASVVAKAAIHDADESRGAIYTPPRDGWMTTSGIDRSPAPAKSDPQWLLTVARDEAQSAATRIRAAIAALTLGEFACDADLARQAYEAAVRAGHGVTGAAKSDLVRANLAYHTVFGDQEVALRIAANYEAIAFSSPNRLSDLRSVSNAAEALLRCGHSRRGMALLDAGFAAAVNCEHAEMAGVFAVRGTWAARQANSPLELTMWRERAADWASHPSALSHPTFLYNEALITLDAEDLAQANARITQLIERFPTDRNEYHHALSTALIVRATCLDGSQLVDAAAVQRLHDWSIRTAPIVPEDDVALTVALALSTGHSQAVAKSYCWTYMNVRRALSYPLRLQIEQLWAALSSDH